jgi:pyruvate dehydrogenase E1 component
LTDEGVHDTPFYKPQETSEEIQYLHTRRDELGGFLPVRNVESPALEIPPLESFQTLLDGSGDREAATTMAFGRILSTLLKNEQVGSRVVPIIPDEARTFGLEALFGRYGIYASTGQLYDPVDAGQLMYYREARDGQILEEGITEAGAMSSFIAAGTSYAHLQTPMIPFYLYYSMFGFQRVGDLIWAAADARTKGFLLGATAGRTTLQGEGLQHEDGHSQLVATTVPSLQSYDPAYAYELAVIVHDGLRRMYTDKESVFYYLTLYNEPYCMPIMPEGADDGILKGMYQLTSVTPDEPASEARPQLFGSGPLLPETLRAQQILAGAFGIGSDVWSVTSYCCLRRDALSVDRYNSLHPDQPPRRSYLEEALAQQSGPFIAVTDYVKLVPDQIRQWVPGKYVTLGTDGFGRSDTRKALRRHFEVDAEHIAFATLRVLSQTSGFDRKQLPGALKLLGLNPASIDPATA